MAGGFYAYTALSPDPAQTITDADGVTKLQLGDELDIDYGYYDDVLPGFDLDTSTSPAEQVVVPAAAMSGLSARIFMQPVGSVSARIGYEVVDAGGVVISDEITDTFTTANSNPAASWPTSGFTVGASGRAYLFVEILTPGGEITISDNGFMEFTYDVVPVARWRVGRIGWPS